MTKKNIIITIVIAVVVGGAGFFGGIKFGQRPAALAKLRQATVAGRAGGAGAFAGGFAGRGGAGGAGGANRGNAFANGQILNKDDKSVTVKMTDGSSKIVFYSASTTIGKSTTGTANDLVVGGQVTINGNSNSDGSINAQNIQIRPDIPPQAPANAQ